MLKPTKVLTPVQHTFLQLASQSNMVNHFYLSGGTALCGFYIPYRYSEDLDFFSENEFHLLEVTTLIKGFQTTLGYKSFDVSTSFNRNLIFIEFEDSTLKTEFTYFPFVQKGTPGMFGKFKIDSLEDIALNKLFTIYQNPRLRDYMDLYTIMERENYQVDELILSSKAKFDWNIDPIQLGSQFLKSSTLEDYPRLVGDFNYQTMQNFYRKLAQSLESGIFG